MAGLVVLGLIVLACFLGPYAFPFTGEDADFTAIALPVDLLSAHPFGTDNFGRDLLVRTLEGGQVSLAIGFVGPSDLRPGHADTLRAAGADYVVHGAAELGTLLARLTQLSAEAVPTP